MNTIMYTPTNEVPRTSSTSATSSLMANTPGASLHGSDPSSTKLKDQSVQEQEQDSVSAAPPTSSTKISSVQKKSNLKSSKPPLPTSQKGSQNKFRENVKGTPPFFLCCKRYKKKERRHLFYLTLNFILFDFLNIYYSPICGLGLLWFSGRELDSPALKGLLFFICGFSLPDEKKDFKIRYFKNKKYFSFELDAFFYLSGLLTKMSKADGLGEVEEDSDLDIDIEYCSYSNEDDLRPSSPDVNTLLGILLVMFLL